MEENREQPTIMQADSVGTEIEERAGGEVGSQKDMSELGKFKSAKALLDAYNTLEKEFTRKCQRISELEKDKTENSTSEIKTELDLDVEINKFLSEHSDASWAVDEIKEKVNSDQSLKTLPNPIEVAWNSVVTNHLSDIKPNDPILNKYVLSDEEIKKVIIENYLQTLKEQKPPIVISSQRGERVSGVMPDAPKTLQEAKVLVNKMFS
jgi:cell fate (sporulation/competence/biofilm development) regulator YlbF (YheA/YmcA/DUF963 family)